MARKPRPLSDENGEIREMDAQEFAAMRPASESVPDIVARAKRRGRPPLERPKTQVTLLLNADIIAHFKAGGRGWQTRLHDVLERHVRRERRKAG